MRTAKLTDAQRDQLWNILKGCGCSDEWLMYHGEYLCDNIAAMMPAPKTVVKEVVRKSYRSSSQPVDFGVGIATGMIIGGMING